MSQDNLEQHLQTVYLSDALDQVLANPTGVHAWHQLAGLFAHCSPQFQQKILQLLQENIPADGVAGFLLTSFCASLRGNAEDFACAGEILLQMQPAHMDRVNAFLLYVWSKLLQDQAEIPTFIAGLKNAQAPQLAVKMGQMLGAAMTQTWPVREVLSIKKVAVIVPHLGPAQHAPTKLALHHVALLMEQGVQVAMFCCQEMLIPHMSQLMGKGESSCPSSGEVEEWAQFLPQPLDLHLGNPRLGLLRRFANMAEKLCNFDPDLLLMVGMYSPLLEFAYPHRPCLGLAVHATAPMANCDAWLCADAKQAGQVHDVWDGHLKSGIAYHYPYRLRLGPAQICSRVDLGLSPDALVLVTLGYRLEQEISGEWAARMRAWLIAHPEAVWLLVGGEGNLPTALQEVDEQQIVLLPHQESVGGILDCCDIYVNPIRLGGGFSVLEAMASALPVLALVGGDGGNKLAEAAHTTVDAYFEHLQALSKDAQLRQQYGYALRARFYQEYDLAQAGSHLLAACELARTRFMLRN